MVPDRTFRNSKKFKKKPKPNASFAYIFINTVKYLKYVHFLQGIVSPHDLAVSQNGETVYVVEVPLDRKNQKIHKYDVINNNPDQGLF